MGVRVEQAGPAAVVVMAWTEQRNALGPDEAREVAEALEAAAAPPDVCGVVLTGDGAFCAGGNLKGAVERSSMSPDERRRLVYGAYQGLVRTLLGLPVPTVAAVDGPAVGMGMDLALACDSRLVGPEGWLRQGWGRVGLVPATGGELLLRRCAPGALWRVLESQEKIDGPVAERLGVGEAVAGRRARERAVERVTTLAAMSRPALEAYVSLHRAELRAQIEAHLEAAVGFQVQLLASPEFADRARAALR